MVLARSLKEDEDLLTAQQVLKSEAEALLTLSASLGDLFVAAVDLISRLSDHKQGRLFVTGIGKSGHIARKIASTFASTGTPSYFIHPSEASHGDLGMITKADALLALSNSGETNELSDLVAYTQRYSIPLIAMTRRPKSSLAEAADIILQIPDLPEACPNGLAPTTSTTVMLALGDALAISLLKRRSFTSEDFQGFHPGGALGKKLLKVSDIMHIGNQLPLISYDISMREALLVMTEKSFGCAGVLDEKGFLIGIVTDGDLRRHMDDHLLKRLVKDIMTPNPYTIRSQALAVEAVSIMNDHSITSLFVLENNLPVGIIHIHDCLRAGIL